MTLSSQCAILQYWVVASAMSYIWIIWTRGGRWHPWILTLYGTFGDCSTSKITIFIELFFCNLLGLNLCWLRRFWKIDSHFTPYISARDRIRTGVLLRDREVC